MTSKSSRHKAPLDKDERKREHGNSSSVHLKSAKRQNKTMYPRKWIVQDLKTNHPQENARNLKYQKKTRWNHNGLQMANF